MAALVLNLTYADVQKKLRAFALDDVAADVADMIELESALVESYVVQIGITDPSAVTATNHRVLYLAARMIVLFRVTAEVMVDFSHEDTAAIKLRNDRADEIENRILSMPETMIDGWHETTHMGAVGYAEESEDIQFARVNSWLGGPLWSDAIGA